MTFNHERLDVYKAAIEYTTWSFLAVKGLSGIHRYARGQLIRAAQSIPLNIAEGTGKIAESDRRCFFEIARGFALECSAIQDVLEACGGIELEENRKGKALLDRILAMLIRMGGRGNTIIEDAASYGRPSESESRSGLGFDPDVALSFPISYEMME